MGEQTHKQNYGGMAATPTKGGQPRFSQIPPPQATKVAPHGGIYSTHQLHYDVASYQENNHEQGRMSIAHLSRDFGGME